MCREKSPCGYAWCEDTCEEPGYKCSCKNNGELITLTDGILACKHVTGIPPTENPYGSRAEPTTESKGLENLETTESKDKEQGH